MGVTDGKQMRWILLSPATEGFFFSSFYSVFVVGERGGIKCTGDWAGKRHFLVWAEGAAGRKEGRQPGSEARRRPPSATVGHSESRAPAGAVETAKTDSREVKKWAAAGPVIEEWLAAEHEEGKVAEGAGVDCCWLSPLFTAAVGLHSTLYQM